MVDTRQGPNTSGKEKKTTKKSNKLSMKDKLVVNMHGVKMKRVVLAGKVVGPARGPPNIEQPKEVLKKRLKKVGDLTTNMPLIMFDFTKQGKEDASVSSKNNETPSTQVNVVEHPIIEVLEIMPLQIGFLETSKGNTHKTIKSFKNIV